MRLVSKLVLIICLCSALNGMAYAGSISAGISVLSISPCAADSRNNEYALSNMPEKSIKMSLVDFVQDIPQMQGYDWSNVKQENKKLLAFLREI